MKLEALIIKLTHRFVLLTIGFLDRPLLDAIVVSMLVLCFIAYLNKVSGKFWHVENANTVDFLEDTRRQSKLIVDWAHLGRGVFSIISMLIIAFACYLVGLAIAGSW